MSDVIEYKCPFCGGAMEFDSKSQHMKCLYCNTEMTVEEFQRTQKPEAETAAEKKTAKENWFSLSSGQWQKDETNHMRVYSCQSCGGEIVADETTGATTCPFCNNKVTIKGQFSGDLKPDYIIPFKLDKKAAKKRYYSHLEGRKYLPKVFRKENHVDEIKGVYIPFWLFDVDAEGFTGRSGMRMFRLHMKRKKFMYRNPMIRSIQPEISIGLFVPEASASSIFRRMPPEKWTIP